jgi:hypothetical protein
MTSRAFISRERVRARPDRPRYDDGAAPSRMTPRTWSIDTASAGNSLVLGFGNLSTDAIEHGVRAIADLLRPTPSSPPRVAERATR